MYAELLRYFLRQQRWRRLPAEDIRRLQVEKFRGLFEFARDRSPFYRRIYKDAGVDKLKVRTWEDIQHVPVVDKRMMRAWSTQDIMTCPITPDLVQTTTSGSTGEPFKIFQTRYEQYTSHVRVFAMLQELGYRPWHLILMLTRMESDAVLPVERDLSLLTRVRKSFGLFRRDILSIYSRPEEIVAWAQARPDAKIFWSTPGICAILCDHLESNGIRLKFDKIVLTSETLSPQLLARISACFTGGQVVSHYGLMECPTIGFDRGGDERKRIFSEAWMVELLNVVRRDGVSEGEPVITNLVNRTMPFIRYNTHDSAVALDDPDCPTKVIGPIRGRMDDVLTLPGGGRFAHHHAHALFMDFDECVQFKFVQMQDGELILRLKLRAGMDPSVVRAHALSRWNTRYPGVLLRIDFVETMPIDQKSGKFKNMERL